jgi:hypothetical protein
MRWRILYVDGDSYSNEQGLPADAPGGGVIAVAQEDELVGTAIHHQSDFYCFGEEYGGWAGMDTFGLTQYLMRPGAKVVKLGELMRTDQYRALLKEIRDDPGLPNRTARYPWEVT